MSLPSTEGTSPRQIASAATASGRFHDVVIAASKVIHGSSLSDADRAALRWAIGLLDAARRRTMVLEMPSAQQLATEGTFAAAIRKAARPPDGNADDSLRELRQGVDKCLRGDKGEDGVAAMQALRELFTVVARLALQADVLSQGEPSPAGSWALSTTNSVS
jgi:hypothetical protein